LLSKPSPEQIVEWAGDRTRRFKALIVQPYVLVQDGLVQDGLGQVNQATKG